MSIAIRAELENVRRLQFGSISGTYAGIGTVFDHPIRMVILQNFTDVMITISDNGFDDKLDLASGTSMILDMSSNKTISQGFFFDREGRFYAKQYSAAPTEGFVSLTAIYGTTGL